MFHGWDSFYLLVGGAAGALIGTMFVVATLTAGLHDTARLTRGSKIFITPIVFHFAVVLVVSLAATAPGLSAMAISLVLAVIASTGLVYAVVTTVRLFRLDWDDAGDWSDRFFYGLLPIIAYAAMAWSAVSVRAMPEEAPYEVAAVMVLILALGIRDAWDLAIAMIKTATQKEAPPQN